MSEEELKKEMEELVKNKMDTFIECYKNGMIFGAPTDIEFYEKIVSLQQKVEQLENENFNIRENIHLERISLPPELTKDKNFMELYDIPSYEDLKNKVEQLENIRKEAIDYVYKHIQEYDADGTFANLDEFNFIASPQTLLNILNKGSDKDV